jgi:hypothetical protein
MIILHKIESPTKQMLKDETRKKKLIIQKDIKKMRVKKKH